MKDNKIISSIKTAGVIATAAFTMASCGHKLSESEKETVKHKTDSAAMVHHEYKLATNLSELCEIKIRNFRRANKDIVKLYAKDYIAGNIKNVDMKKFMLNMINEEAFITESFSDVIESDTVSNDVSSIMRNIRKNQRWFNDLMLFLTDEYSERQFLKSEFFKVVNDARLRTIFETNTERMEKIQTSSDFAKERKAVVYQQLWNKYENEVQRKR